MGLTIGLLIVVGATNRSPDPDASDHAGWIAHERYLARVMDVSTSKVEGVMTRSVEILARQDGVTFKTEADKYGTWINLNPTTKRKKLALLDQMVREADELPKDPQDLIDSVIGTINGQM